jgi:rhodanese-related sulfurtransferase
MLRRVLRRLVRGPSKPTPPPRPRPTPEPAVQEEEEELDLEVEGPELKTWLDGGRDLHFLDIREPGEVRTGVVVGCQWIPMNSVPDRLEELPQDKTLIVYCAAGARSYGVTHWLREQGFEDTWSLVGGLGAWLAEGGEWGQLPDSDG